MELLAVTVQCYKRFKKTTSLQTNGKLVALLGPNEAGKSTLLNAIAHLGHTNPPSAEELSRDVDPQNFRIIGRFFLNEDDLTSSGLSGPRTFIVHKYPDGSRRFNFEPPAPTRNIAHRDSLIQAIELLLDNEPAKERILQIDDNFSQKMTSIVDSLRTENETLSELVVAELENMIEAINVATSTPTSADNRFFAVWADAVDREHAPTPFQKAVSALKSRIPPFLVFDEQARNLASSYSISSLRQGVPPALANLVEVAGLDLNELFLAIDQGLNAKITTLERRASETLGRKFKEAWKQSGTEVAIRIQGDEFEVQIVNSNSEFTAFAERSDGLRQFVALQMFATRNHADKPVLLIDEADQRLHYDAQADLVQMLARQQLSPKVIFTTHSAGCLPEDLGNGVRTIVQNPADGSSKIVNRFWNEPGHGLTPLLFGLGAATLAFFPTRRAVMVEGPSDMLLFPTLLREALGQASLGFQFVPGLSENKGALEPQALITETNVLHVVDADPGGKAIEKRLLENGVPAAHILVLKNPAGTALELEDFVIEGRLLEAANEIITKWHPTCRRIESFQPANGTRMNTLEHMFRESTGRKLPKVDLAYNLLDMVNSNPSLPLLDPRRIAAIKGLANKITSHFANVESSRITPEPAG